MGFVGREKSKTVILHENLYYGRLIMHIIRANAMVILSRRIPLEFP